MPKPLAYLINDTSITGHPGCVTVMAEIRNNLEQRGIAIAGTWPVGLNWRLGLTASPKFQSASAVIVNGEGTIHDSYDRPRARQLLEFASYMRMSKSVPLFLVNASIENIHGEGVAGLRAFNRIYVRESASQAYLKSCGIDSCLVPDLCITAGYARSEIGHDLLVTDSMLPTVETALRHFAIANRARYLRMKPRKFGSRLNWVFRPSAFIENAERFIADIGAARQVVTGRFHAAVFCLLAGTPFLAVASNTSKIQSMLMDIFDNTDRMIDSASLYRMNHAVPPFSVSEVKAIELYKIVAKERTQGMFDQIAKAARDSGIRQQQYGAVG